MVGYHAQAASVAATVTPFTVPPELTAFAAQIGAQLVGAAQAVGGTFVPLTQSLISGASLQSLASLAQSAASPVGMLISPLMSLAQSANGAGLAGTAAGELADVPTFVGDAAPAAMRPPGGLGLGAGLAGELGKARLVGSMSVPPSWPGSMPAQMASSAVMGLGGGLDAAGSAAAGGGMPMMPMPMGMGGTGAGMPAGMMGRGGAGSQVVQQRPSVIPRTGVG